MARKTYKTSETVDFIVVGSGASGGIMARELALAGNSVVVMEQGPRLSASEFEHDELKYRNLSGITNNPATNPQSFRKSPDQKAERVVGRNPLTYARVVGGSSAHFNANFWRLHEIDFIERSRLGSIEGADLVDWPITYAELEAYYTKVEWEVGVSGLAGSNPNDPWRSKPYPMPPLPVKASGVLFERGARNAFNLHRVTVARIVADFVQPLAAHGLRLIAQSRLDTAARIAAIAISIPESRRIMCTSNVGSGAFVHRLFYVGK